MVKSFLAILLRCSTKASRWHGVDIMPGQFVTSRSHLADLLGISIQQTRTVLRRLVDTHEITVQTTSAYTMITVCRWKDYQVINQQSNQENDLKSDDLQPADQPAFNHPSTTDKNIKKDNIYPPLCSPLCDTQSGDLFVPPPDDVQKSFKQWTEEDFKKDVASHSEYSEIAERFVDYWSEKSASGRMRFQMEKTWETLRRLKYWASRNSFGSSSSPVDRTKKGF